jgi:hypothetical protein
MNSVDVRMAQFTLFVTRGLASRLDLSVALPVVRVDLDVVSKATIQRIGTAAYPSVHFFRGPGGEKATSRSFAASGSASGIGDALLRLKGTAWRRGATGVALGLDVLLPTGAEVDLLGSGALGIRPFLALSSVHRISPHIDLAYQWNGESLLAGNPATGRKAELPAQIIGAVGADMRIGRRLTLALDLIGRRLLDSPRLESVTFHALDGRSTFPNIQFRRGPLGRLDGSAGVKWNPVGKLLVDVNVQFKLNTTGVRDHWTPLVGIEYSF